MTIFLNHHRKQFLQVYFRIFKNNPKLCIKAYLLESYGFWAFHSVHGNQSYLTVLQENEFGFYRSPKLPRPLVRPATHYYKYIGNSIGSAGTFAWLLLSFCLLLLIFPKGKKIYPHRFSDALKRTYHHDFCPYCLCFPIRAVLFICLADVAGSFSAHCANRR